MAPVDRHPTFTTHRRRRSSASTGNADVVSLRRPAPRRLSWSGTNQRYNEGSLWDKVLNRPQILLGVIITLLFLLGTAASIYLDSSVDTSLLHNVHNHSPIRSAYFARKDNILNRVFVKKAWGWTVLVYVVHLISSPDEDLPRLNISLPNVPAHRRRRTRSQRLAALVIASLAWIAVTSWFFGAGIGDRVIALSGGHCAVPLPAGMDPGQVEHLLPSGHKTPLILHGSLTEDANGHTHVRGHIHETSPNGPARVFLPLPHAFCSHRVPLNADTHPDLFSLLVSVGDGVKSTNNITLPRPRWSGGFDISGHAFLLTLGALLLAQELAPSWRAFVQGQPRRSGPLGTLHRLSTVSGTILVLIWVWMLEMTAIYFHNPDEKLAGLALGLIAAAIVDIVTPRSASASVIEYKVRPGVRRASAVPASPRIVIEADGSRREYVYGRPVASGSPLASSPLAAASPKAAQVGSPLNPKADLSNGKSSALDEATTSAYRRLDSSTTEGDSP